MLGSVGSAGAQPVRFFQLEDIWGHVEAGFFTDLQDRSRSVSDGSEFDRVELSQLLRLNTHGYIYHPRFMTFDTGVQIEAIQGLAGQSDDRFLWGGNFQFNFLQAHANSLSVYGTRVESEASRQFSETYDLTNELYGVTYFKKWGWLPFDLSYQHSSISGGVDNQLDDTRDRVIFDGRYSFTEQSYGKLGYDLAYEDIRGRDIRRQSLLANNLSYFGDVGNKTLRTDLRLFEERDGRRIRNANGSTEFDWRHSDTLRTRYYFNGRWDEFGSQETTNLDANFFLDHQLYESLQSGLEIFGHVEDSSFRERQEFGGRISQNYSKKLRDWGRLSVLLSPHASVAYNQLDEDTAFVVDEVHVLIGFQPVVLGQQDIIASSIVVTDSNGSIIYDEGSDYIVNQTGGGFTTTIERAPFSDIADGERVLVDYEFELLGDADLVTAGVHFNTSLQFLEHWTVFGRYEHLDFHVLSGDKDDLRLNDYDRYSGGMSFGARWFAAKVEVENNDARITPSWGYSGSASLFTYGMQSWSGRLNANYSYLNQQNQGPTVKRYSMTGVASKRFFKWGMLEAEGGWLRGRWSGESSDSNDIDSFYVNLRYSWWYGKVEVKVDTGFAQILRPTEDRKVYQFNLRLRRVF
jgi:hypothetical protein